MRNIFVISPRIVATSDLIPFVNTLGGEWDFVPEELPHQRGWIDRSDALVWIEGDTSLDPFEADPECLNWIRNAYDFEPLSALAIAVSSDVNSIDLAEEVAEAMIKCFDGRQLDEKQMYADLNSNNTYGT
jgi:hypothetical protein